MPPVATLPRPTQIPGPEFKISNWKAFTKNTLLGFCTSELPSGLILHGDQDSAVPAESVQKLVHKLSHQRDIKIEFRKIAGADHFFADPEPLATHVDSYILAHPRFAEPPPPAAAAQGRGR